MKINLINEQGNKIEAGDIVFNTISNKIFLVIENDGEYAFLDLVNHKTATYFKSIGELEENNMGDHYKVVKSNKVELNVDLS